MDAQLHDVSVVRWWTPLTLLVVGPLLGALLGAATNWVNAEVSSDYFVRVMGWLPYRIRERAVTQGVIEGSGLGAFFGLFFAIATAASTRMRCPLRIGLRAVAVSVAIVLASWLLGGLIGLALGVASPSLWGSVFVPAPGPSQSVPRFAWVGGTIWGAYGGTLIGLLVASMLLHRQWKRIVQRGPGFETVPAIPFSADLSDDASRELRERP